MNGTDATSLRKENHPDSKRALPESHDSTPMQGVFVQALEATASTEAPDGQEAYERGLALKNVCLFRQAAEQFEKAAQDPAYALKGFAQMGLSLRRSGKQEEAVKAFREALQAPSMSSKERVQILYLLGRTFESLARVSEALEAYRWLRREAPQYRDVGMRIESLSTKRIPRENR